MKQKVILGIDAGTSSIKVSIFSLEGKPLGRKHSPVDIIIPTCGRAEVDVNFYFTTMISHIKELLKEDDYVVCGIGLATTCPTVVCLDENFNSIGNGILYLDNRSHTQLERYMSYFKDDIDYFSTIGNRCSHSTCSASTMKWIKEHEPERWSQTKYIGMLNSFLAGKLTGKSAIDITQASYSGVFKLSQPEDWDSELLDLMGVPREKLLPIAQPFSSMGTILPEIAKETGIPEGTKVAIGSADTAAAAFAINFTNTNHAFESAGTSGVLTFVTDEPIFQEAFMNRCHIFPDTWLAHGATSMMGGSIDWLLGKVFTEYPNYDSIDQVLLTTTAGANGTIFLPYLSGERSPIWDPHAKGVWYGLTVQSDKHDLIRSVYEASAYAMHQIKELRELPTHNAIKQIFAVGNGTKSKLWSQLKSDVLQAEYHTTLFPDAAALGAALLGGIAAGVYSSVHDPNIPFLKMDGDYYYPTKDKDVIQAYEHSFNTYKSLYPVLKNVMHS
ncbi:MAG: FGGY family carbohydrate kinase [Sphaerochaetaceae bacterium]